MENARILIYGTGTVGIFFGSRLEKAGFKVTFADRPERASFLNETGLSVRGLDGDYHFKPEVVGDLEGMDSQDLILICVKAIHTYDIALNLLPVIKPATAVLSFQNGLENEKILSDLLGPNLLMGTVLQFHGRLEEGCRSVQDAPAQVLFGELDHQPSSREEWLSKIFSRADINHVITHQINQKIWEHFLWNSIYNSIGALTKSTLQEILEFESMRPTIEQMMSETIRVASAEGVVIPLGALEELNREQAGYTHIKPAMLQDIEAGRHPELEPMLGVILNKAKAKGISTPANAAVYHLLQLSCTHIEIEEP
ncbi:MAG: hypothetical protein A2527_10210 [Candidatus Lambdaproteobacteria bacterium RIFOXYD2_FULL_50_16]|uniref:2-dehydropantoate 2-reductase n=1 Tax=Candidatus Lambdaproteobacteria bacterium RIFOXYD2_FULL_50_16 TaxID=1817772 RepID=A0A1F6GGE7_9PROT|nr:MAG: hypothetical protein A2527_10210 [Candidatus Lambdaproteobacteria bacterium RIFOXYD2_FULL_50_16]